MKKVVPLEDVVTLCNLKRTTHHSKNQSIVIHLLLPQRLLLLLVELFSLCLVPWPSMFALQGKAESGRDRKSTRLNSSHVSISYAVFCLKKKKHTYYSCTEYKQ